MVSKVLNAIAIIERCIHVEANERLKEIKERRAKITKPPWILMPELCGPEGQGIYQQESMGIICEVGDPYPRGGNRPQETMEFLVNAPDDIDFLMSLVEKK